MRSEIQAVKDELLEEARIYIDDQTEMVLDTVKSYEHIPLDCSKCKEDLEEIYSRPDDELQGWNDFDLVVLKCEKCKSYLAFYVQPFTEQVQEFITPREEEILKVLPQQYDVQTRLVRKMRKRATEFNSVYEIYREKMNPIKKLSNETIKHIHEIVEKHIKTTGYSAHKKYNSLIAAATYKASQETVEERLTERKISQIFGVTRKTLRRWVKKIDQY